jgi:integrase
MIPGFVAEALAEHLAKYPPSEDGRLFSTRQGRIITAPSFRKVTWLSACKRVGLNPAPRFHDLRHTSVALAIKEGAHPKQIQSRLGHTSIQMTLDIYGHLFPGLDEELAERLDVVGREASDRGALVPLSASKGGQEEESAARTEVV